MLGETAAHGRGWGFNLKLTQFAPPRVSAPGHTRTAGTKPFPFPSNLGRVPVRRPPEHTRSGPLPNAFSRRKTPVSGYTRRNAALGYSAAAEAARATRNKRLSRHFPHRGAAAGLWSAPRPAPASPGAGPKRGGAALRPIAGGTTTPRGSPPRRPCPHGAPQVTSCRRLRAGGGGDVPAPLRTAPRCPAGPSAPGGTGPRRLAAFP